MAKFSKAYYKIFSIILIQFLGLWSCTKLSDLIPRNRDSQVNEVDTTPPVVRIISPTNGQVFEQNTVRVVIRATDDKSGIKAVYLRLNNQGFVEVGRDNEISLNITANEGTNRIYAYALDNSQNRSSTVSLSFVVLSRPVVIISSPNDLSIFDNDQVSVTGSVISYYQVSNVFLRVGDSGGFGVVNGTESWNTNLIFDTEGLHRIYVFALDVSNRVSRTNHISILVLLDKIHVSTTGNDTNTGLSKNLPVKTIQVGLQRAYEYQKTNILVQVGTYLPGDGLNTEIAGVIITNDNLRIIGGLNEDFSRIVGNSVLDARKELYHVVFATNISNILLMNFHIAGGSATNTDDAIHSRGGGIYLHSVINSEIANIIISNNYSVGEGAGIYLDMSVNCSIKATIVSNSIVPLTNESFGIANIRSSSGIFELVISSNNGRGFAWHSYYSQGFLENSIISHNNGGGLYVAGKFLTASNVSIFNNIASEGAGINLDFSGFAIFNSYITNNKGTVVNSSIRILGQIAANGGNTYEAISNCYIGGDGANTGSIGIDQVGYKPPNLLRDNKFITNTLQYLYKKFGDPNPTNDINAINNPSYFSPYGCDTGDNIVTNM
ncbi:MAG: Ig-like domain-containing protein [Spirochaetes bacterium]|nr:Ig-like domain-containing protein [Spirochaetota bacterium]